MAFLKSANPDTITSICTKRSFCNLVLNKPKKCVVTGTESKVIVPSRLTTVSATSVKNIVGSGTEVPSRKDPLDLSFANPEAAFKSKTTWEVIRALIVYQLCSSSYLVNNNMKVKIMLFV